MGYEASLPACPAVGLSDARSRNSRGMGIWVLCYFVEIAREENMSRAARRLHVTADALQADQVFTPAAGMLLVELKEVLKEKD